MNTVYVNDTVRNSRVVGILFVLQFKCAQVRRCAKIKMSVLHRVRPKAVY